MSVELVRAVKWQEVAPFDVTPQFYMYRPKEVTENLVYDGWPQADLPSYEVRVVNTKLPRSLTLSPEPNNSIQMPSDMTRSRDWVVGIVSMRQAARTVVRILAEASEQFIPTLCPTRPPIQWLPGFFAGGTGRGRWWPHVPLAPRLRISGAETLLPLYAFMAWTVTLPFFEACAFDDQLFFFYI